MDIRQEEGDRNTYVILEWPGFSGPVATEGEGVTSVEFHKQVDGTSI
jgi:hypothetical protein